MVARRVTGTQLSHARDRKEPAPGLIVKRPEDAPDYDKACRSYNHFDHEHPFEPHDPWYDHGHTRAGRPQVKRQEEDRSTASTVIASILVKTTATGHCDIEIKDVDGKIVDHLPCVQERLQSLSTRPHMAANASGRTLPGTEPEHHGHQSPRRSLRHSQRITPRASRIFNAASLRRPAAPALIQRRRGDSRSTRNQQDQRMPSATHKTYMSGGQLRIGNLDALHNFFYYRFWILEQNPCKKIIKHLVDAIVPKKQTQLPYQGKPKQGRTAAHLPDTRTVKTPGFWPPGIPYTGPDRAQRSERLTILAHLMTLPLKDAAEWRSIVHHRIYKSTWKSYHECLTSILSDTKLASPDTPVLGDKERNTTRNDWEGNWKRHNARLAALREMIEVAGYIERCALSEIDETQVITYGALHPDVEYTKGKQEEEDKDNHRLTHGSASSSSVLEPTGTVQDLDGDGDGDTEPDSELNEWQPDNDFQEPCDDHLNYRGDGAAASIDQAAEAPTATGPDSWMHIKPHTDHQSTQPSSASASFGSSFAASYDGSNAPYSMEEPHSTRAPVPQAPKLACAEAARPSGTKRSSAADQADRVSKPRIVPEVKGSAVPSSRARDGARGRAATNSHRRANYRSTSASPPMGIPNQIFYEGKSGVVDDSRNGLPTPSMRYMSTTYCPAIDYETFHAEVRAGLREPGQAYSGLHPRPEEASSHQAFPPHVPQNHATSAYQPVANGCATQSHTIDPTLMADTPMTDLMTPSYFDESWEIPSYNTATGSNYDNFEDFSYPQPEFYSNGAPRGSYHHHTFG